MPIPAHLRNAILHIPDLEDATLTAIVEHKDNGTYTYSVTLPGEYSAWSGLVSVPESDVSQNLRNTFRNSNNSYVRLNPTQPGTASFGNQVQRMSTDNRAVLALTMAVNGNEYTGWVRIRQDDSAFQGELKEHRFVAFASKPRPGKLENVWVYDVEGKNIELAGKVKVRRVDQGSAEGKMAVAIPVGQESNRIFLEGEISEEKLSGRLEVVDGTDW